MKKIYIKNFYNLIAEKQSVVVVFFSVTSCSLQDLNFLLLLLLSRFSRVRLCATP